MPTRPFLSKYWPPAVARTRLLLVGAGCLWVFIILGCMSLSIGGSHIIPLSDHEPFCQRGSTALGPEGEREIYYPIPFASPPYLEVEDPLAKYVIVEQHADHFRIRGVRDRFPSEEVRWKARGLRAPLPAVPGPTVIPLAPVPTLPPPRAEDIVTP